MRLQYFSVFLVPFALCASVMLLAGCGGGGGAGAGGGGGAGGGSQPLPSAVPKLTSYGVSGTVGASATCTLDGTADLDGSEDAVFRLNVAVVETDGKALNDHADFIAQSATQSANAIIGISSVAP